MIIEKTIDKKISFIYDENDKIQLEDSVKDILYDKSRGYISYLRGENPISFPYRLYPNNSIIEISDKDIFNEIN